jgi:secondary thiamine-phosphate synthase enzyme
MLKTISIATKRRNELIDISDQIAEAVRESRVHEGIATVFVPHTTAGVTINENADPDVVTDLLHKLQDVFPKNDGYHHAEGNSDAHIKASLLGASVQIIVHEGKLLLGTWQGIYFCEFDGPRTRTCYIKVA